MKEKSSASEDEIHGTCSLREARVTPGMIYLSPTVRVRQGRGTSLVVERRLGGGKWQG